MNLAMLGNLGLLAQRYSDQDMQHVARTMTGVFVVYGIISLAAYVLVAAGMWKIFQKAGQPGWAAIVPFYNVFLLLKIANKPTWWIVWFILPAALFCVPFLNLALIIAAIVYWILIWIEVCKKFGKTGGYVVGVILLGFVFIPMLGFGSAQFQPTAGNQPPLAPPPIGAPPRDPTG